MSIWKEVGKCLNSTIKTPLNCIPLDKMIENSKLEIKNYIDTQISGVKSNIEKMLSSTTGVGKVLRTDTITENERGYFDYVLTKFVPPVSGLYKIGVEINYSVPEDTTYRWMSPNFEIWSVPVKRTHYATEAHDTSSSGTGFDYIIKTESCDTWKYYLDNNIGREYDGIGLGAKEYIATCLGQFDCSYNTGSYPTKKYKEFLFLCEAGVPVVITAEDINSDTSTKYYRKIHSIRSTVTYGNA